MGFIDRKTSQEIAEWNRKHPEEAKEFAKLHKEWYQLWREHKISYEEFSKRHEEWRKKHILGE